MRRPESIDPTQQPAHPDGWRLRRMALDDLDEVMDIERLAFSHPWSADLFRRELTHDWSTVLVAEHVDARDGPRLGGFIIYWLVHDEVHVLNVATAPQLRRQGLARTLLQRGLALAREAGARLATLEVRRTNVPAIRLYESFGFRSVGIRPNYYAEENEDAIVMVLDLP